MAVFQFERSCSCGDLVRLSTWSVALMGVVDAVFSTVHSGDGHSPASQLMGMRYADEGEPQVLDESLRRAVQEVSR